MTNNAIDPRASGFMHSLVMAAAPIDVICAIANVPYRPDYTPAERNRAIYFAWIDYALDMSLGPSAGVAMNLDGEYELVGAVVYEN